MKLKSKLPASAMVLWLCMSASSQAQLTIHYDFTPGSIVPDGNGQLSIVQNLGGLAGLSSITDVNARLNLTTGNAGDPMFLGDLYSSLTFGNTSETQSTAVLLNRPGRDNSNAFGSSLSSLNVTLDDSAATNVFSTTSSTGTYQADGRLSVNPNAAGVAFASGSNGLSALNVTPPASNRVSLLVADYSSGGVATLSGWGFSTTGTAASSGTFTPGANSSLSDGGSGDTNTIGAILSTTGATGGSMQLNFAGTTTFTNGVTGSAGITKLGAGTVILGGSSGYTGATSVTAGTLAIASGGSTHASSAVTVTNSGSALVVNGTVNGTLLANASTTLSGSGTVNGAASVNGNLTPGNSGVGLLSFGSSLAMASSTATTMEINGTGLSNHDSIDINGALTYDGALALAIGATFGVGTYTFDLFDITSQSGSFDTVALGGLYSASLVNNGFGVWGATTNSGNETWTFTQSTGDLSLVVIPEPNVAALIGGFGMLCLLRRRR